MKRIPFLLSVLLVAAMALVPLGTTAASAAPAPPSVTRLSASAGPLAPVRVTITGQRLTQAQRVTFGGRAATGLRRLSSTRISVLTPRATRPGAVAVRVKTPSGWSRATARATFTYLAVPRVTGVSPATGPMTGGERITLTGSGFRAGAVVRFGTSTASGLRVVSARTLTILVPPGLDGTAPVSVTTPGGRSPAAAAASYQYVLPAAADSESVDAADGTFVADTALWVTGGPQSPDADSPDEPWIVGLPSDVEPPAVGTGLLVPPGTAVYPTGLAGTVSDVALQADLTYAVTVAVAPLSSSLDDLQAHYAGPVGDEDVDTGTSRRRAVEDTITFRELSPGRFLCEDENGTERSFAGSVGFRMENVRTSFFFDAGGWFDPAQLSAWVKGDVVVYGKVTGTAKMTCKLRPEWQNSMRRVIPLGTTGLTLSVGPTATFTLSARGTFQIEQRTTRMIGLAKFGDQPLRPYNISVDKGFSSSASAELLVAVSAGVSVQFGILDRAGFEGKLVLTASARVTLRTPPPQACVRIGFSLDISIGAFLDLWVARWTRSFVNHSVPLAVRERCTDRAEDVESEAPEIATARLPRAEQGRSYSAYVGTVDGREGTWSAPSGLPAGLALDPGTGEVSGVPTGAVGDYALVFRFVDLAGQAAQSVVWLYLAPVVLGGGDVQTTLIWSSAADLDLYVTDPSGETVYYGNDVSTSGGRLDRDSNAACDEALTNPVENVTWPTDGAPSGTYVAQVDVWSTCGAVDLSWRLIVRVEGAVVLDTTGEGNSVGYTFSNGAASRRPVAPGASLPRPPKAGVR